MNRLAIIGTAGRKDDSYRMQTNTYVDMYSSALFFIKNATRNNISITKLVSGGAAYADHIAVKLFNDNIISLLTLYLPCEFHNGKYISHDTSISNTINYYHMKFSERVKIDSLLEIQTAITKGATIINCDGFKQRNKYIIDNSDYILAMTYGHKNKVKAGGTSHAIKYYLSKIKKTGGNNNAMHYNLYDNTFYLNCAA